MTGKSRCQWNRDFKLRRQQHGAAAAAASSMLRTQGRAGPRTVTDWHPSPDSDDSEYHSHDGTYLNLYIHIEATIQVEPASETLAHWQPSLSELRARHGPAPRAGPISGPLIPSPLPAAISSYSG